MKQGTRDRRLSVVLLVVPNLCLVVLVLLWIHGRDSRIDLASVAKSVVRIEISDRYSGAGCFVSGSGAVLTALHVVQAGDMTSSITVWGLFGEGEIEGRPYVIVEAFPDLDAAILRPAVAGIRNKWYARIACDSPEISSPVFVLFWDRLYPRNLPGYLSDLRSSSHMVALHGDVLETPAQRYFLVSCRVWEGVSGAPVWNRKGLLIGTVEGSLTGSPGVRRLLVCDTRDIARTARYRQFGDVHDESKSREDGEPPRGF